MSANSNEVVEHPMPMSMDEVLRLPKRKALAKAASGLAESLMDRQPEMVELDGRLYPAGAEAVEVPMLKGADAQLAVKLSTEGFIPDHAEVDYVPRLEPRAMRRPKFIERNQLAGAVPGAKTIFGRDDRKVFYSTAYPWRCNGRVETPLGFGSGVMVGPRHLLTCSHIIDWLPNGTGWLKFTPMYYNGSAPYGAAWAVRVFSKFKVRGPTIDPTEAQFDYVCVVLNSNIGNATGWLGTKGYSDSWDGNAVFTHVGYPADLTGMQRPVFVNGVALDGDFWTTDAHQRIDHKADVWPGQSGGPFWGYWSGSPFAVATQSGQTPSNNSASGGSNLVDLVSQARAAFP